MTYTPIGNATLFINIPINNPGIIPDHPTLYSSGSYPKECGQILFISTLEDGSPDPNAFPQYMQMNTGCKKEYIGGMIVEVQPIWEPPTSYNIPEPSTLSMVGMVVLVCLLMYAALRSRQK